ncbi:unnamed protein product [Cyclocybe aegerita]|uniref:Uncharacterized protein n=1 Tax=Cyclocybe aegerita TaxID=1973307 RepID=A0A8S0XTF4_CYCAE|nr:unnamed protein product [Cyclocybe aegerita]
MNERDRCHPECQRHPSCGLFPRRPDGRIVLPVPGPHLGASRTPTSSTRSSSHLRAGYSQSSSDDPTLPNVAGDFNHSELNLGACPPLEGHHASTSKNERPQDVFAYRRVRKQAYVSHKSSKEGMRFRMYVRPVQGF